MTFSPASNTISQNIPLRCRSSTLTLRPTERDAPLKAPRPDQTKDSGGAGAETPAAPSPRLRRPKETGLPCLEFGWHHEAEHRSRPNASGREHIFLHRFGAGMRRGAAGMRRIGAGIPPRKRRGICRPPFSFKKKMRRGRWKRNFFCFGFWCGGPLVALRLRFARGRSVGVCVRVVFYGRPLRLKSAPVAARPAWGASSETIAPSTTRLRQQGGAESLLVFACPLVAAI